MTSLINDNRLICKTRMWAPCCNSVWVYLCSVSYTHCTNAHTHTQVLGSCCNMSSAHIMLRLISCNVPLKLVLKSTLKNLLFVSTSTHPKPPLIYFLFLKHTEPDMGSSIAFLRWLHNLNTLEKTSHCNCFYLKGIPFSHKYFLDPGRLFLHILTTVILFYFIDLYFCSYMNRIPK